MSRLEGHLELQAESAGPGLRGWEWPGLSPSLCASWLAVSSWHEVGGTERA